MLTIRATLKNGKITFLDDIALPLGENYEHQILITFLDTDIKTIFGVETSQKEVDPEYLRFQLGLTDRELEVLRFVQQGLSNQQIADKLEIGHGTTRNYLSSVYEKLKVENRTGAVSKAIELGILD